ncbi:MAG: NACHT domain-containing protein [Clostridiales bacterium]|jgi:hypothetical protein|nr:NACHT domain-containing protein [Clostridiales bacterium]
MKFCFGTLAGVLLLCANKGVRKLTLCNVLVKSVDRDCTLTSNAVTSLLQCAANLPDGKSNSLGNVISGGKDADPVKTAAYFSDKVIKALLDPNKRKLAVLAITDLIRNDDGIGGDVVVDRVGSKTKNALLMQSRFVLSEFLAGVFLFATQVNNIVGKEESDAVTDEYLVSFASLQDTISFVVPPKESDSIETILEVFAPYLEKAKDRYQKTKTLLYKDEPKLFYDFYIPNHVERRMGRAQNVDIAEVTAESLTAISNFVMLTGVGGQGKSMMMRHLLLDAVSSYAKLRRIPVFVTLKDYGGGADNLAEFVYGKVAALCAEATKEAFSLALESGMFLLLFDGLDEIDCKHGASFEREIEAFTDRYANNSFVISSRPIQSFVSFSRYTTVKLKPFTKGQALAFVDKSDFRPDQPEIQWKFRETLDKSLFKTHRSFAENPLLLTIMLLTFEQYAEVPTKMHIFYREAFNALSVTHDATKGAFKRALRMGLSIDEVRERVAEICFRSYRDEKYEFTADEFTGYFNKANKGDKAVTADDFLYDLSHNLCLTYFESGKYHFIHRSFQEYFAALFMSKQTDEFLGKLGSFFEKRSPRVFANSAFPMLYDIIQPKVEQFIFVPFLTDLFARCDAKEGYWTFLEEMYPYIYYNHGEVDESPCNDPQSYILEFILRLIDYKHTLTPDDLPFYEELVDEEVAEDTAPLLVEKRDSDGNVVEAAVVQWPYYDLEEGEYPPDPEVIGYKLELDIEAVRQEPDKYAELLKILNDDSFIFKAEYNAGRAYLESLKGEIQQRRDDLSELL